MFLFPNEGWASKLPKDPKALDRSQLAAVSGCCVFTWQNDDEASRVESSSKWSARPSARLSALRGPSARLSVLRGLAAVWLLSGCCLFAYKVCRGRGVVPASPLVLMDERSRLFAGGLTTKASQMLRFAPQSLRERH